MNSNQRPAFRLFACASILFWLAVPGLQASSVLSWTGGTYVPSAYQQTVGWNFNVNTAIQVSALQWYDTTGTNVLQHDVDVWTSAGALVGSLCRFRMRRISVVGRILVDSCKLLTRDWFV